MLGSLYANRPRLPLRSSPSLRFWQALGLAGVLAIVGFLAYAWPRLPDIVPVHFGASGEADGWGPKSTLLLLFGMGPLLYLALAALSRYPHIFNYLVEITEDNAERQYLLAREMLAAVNTTVVWLFAVIAWASVRAALDGTDELGPAMLAVILVGGVVAPLGIVVVYLIRSG